MDEYVKRAESIEKNTHLAMIDTLNHQLLKLKDKLSRWENNESNIQQQQPVQKALKKVEKLYKIKYPNDKSLSELLPLWYNKE